MIVRMVQNVVPISRASRPGGSSLSNRLSGSSVIIFFFLATSFLSQSTGSKAPQSQVLDCSEVVRNDLGQVRGHCAEADPSSEGSATNSSTRPGFALNFTNQSVGLNIILRNRRQDKSDCLPGRDQDQSDQSDSASEYLCSPRPIEQQNQANNYSVPNEASQKIKVDIYSKSQSNSSYNSTSLLGEKFSAECRFTVLSLDRDLKFKLRWLRALTTDGKDAHFQATNQSIYNRHHVAVKITNLERSSNPDESGQLRVGTNRLDHGLELNILELRESDLGDYFCQAVISNAANQDKLTGETILDEKKIHIETREPEDASNERSMNQTNLGLTSGLTSRLYSQENLLKLLPSLIVVPDYAEPALGDTVHLSCITNELDPDPQAELFEWSFEAGGSKNEPDATGQSEPQQRRELPENTTAIGGQLIIWSVGEQHSGVYTCQVSLEDYNLTATATSELKPRPSADSAPLVFISPELVRLSAGGSARIQCEATGYPAPKLEWYRAEIPISNEQQQQRQTNSTALSYKLIDEPGDGTLEVEHVSRQDAEEFCKQNSCLSSSRQKRGQPLTATAISLVRLSQARAHHQGQYVCKASNKHGSNQVSSLVDVEFKERPLVKLDHERQTIVLSDSNVDSDWSKSPNKSAPGAEFRCSVVAGRPRPRLRWLRASGLARMSGDDDRANLAAKLDKILRTPNPDLDLYDLAKVSSATSRVSTWLESDGKTLVLALSTISVQDEGEYICMADNELGSFSAIAHLTVRRPASVRIVQPSPKIARPNESFHLECRISGHPAPQDIEWSRSDRGAFFALISNQPAPQERAVLKFDRVTKDEAGEYTCAARDPLNPSAIIRDTIMVLVEEEPIDPMGKSPASHTFDQLQQQLQKQLPQLMVRPTKVSVPQGANITLDCLAMSGLQPTVVEWLAPVPSTNPSLAPANQVISIRPYYRSQYSLIDDNQQSPLGPVQNLSDSRGVLQFGSKLRIFNASKAHEGVYQCKGRNRAGVENAPALIKILEADHLKSSINGAADGPPDSTEPEGALQHGAKTKIAQAGSNIELRCQVDGVEQQPATSWSREGKELPKSSYQIEHYLWIRNLSQADEGLYLCSARSNEPNQVIQARINLLVRNEPHSPNAQPLHQLGANLSAKIVASKSSLNIGDSVTLECTISQEDSQQNASSSVGNRLSLDELDELEQQVIWTNLHSGQSIFQENVYIQNNLLIIYGLRAENSATYRCNFNDLRQHIDYQLQVLSELGQPNASEANTGETGAAMRQDESSANAGQLQVKKVLPNSRVSLDCRANGQATPSSYYWISSPSRRTLGLASAPLVFDSISSQQADVYQCFASSKQQSNGDQLIVSYVILVQTTSARFVQHPVSFVTLPAASIASMDRRVTEIEIKFLPEREHGLLLFSGGSGSSSGGSNNSSDTPLRSNFSDSPETETNPMSGPMSGKADFISIGLSRGYLQVRFELGDGITMLRSQQRLALNEWHRVVVERLWRNATLWLDDQRPQTVVSAGKFLDLNLDDSLLFVGGHQAFNFRNANQNNSHPAGGGPTSRARFYSYSGGFQGCVSHLRINGRELDLMARNRTVSVGVFECDKQECTAASNHNRELCLPHGFCQVDRSAASYNFRLGSRLAGNQNSSSRSSGRRNASVPNSDLRCICAPDRTGPTCDELVQPKAGIAKDLVGTSTPSSNSQDATSSIRPNPMARSGPCEQQAACNANGTLECQSLTSSSHKCHCRLGHTGDQCELSSPFTDPTSVHFNQGAFLQFEFNTGLESHQQQVPINSTSGAVALPNISFTDQINISLVLQTRSSYGMFFYIGSSSTVGGSDPLNDDAESRRAAAKQSRSLGGLSNSALEPSPGQQQSSKSVVANLLARLANQPQSRVNSTPNKVVADFLALALIDGHVELSFELGSGPAIIRSSRRINDGLGHKIDIQRRAKLGVMLIDDNPLMRHEGHSPGRLSALNTAPDIFLGALPRLQALGSSSSSSALLMSNFTGCISQLQINSLGPLDLIESNQLTRIKSGRNLIPCASSGQQLIASPPSLDQSQVLTSQGGERFNGNLSPISTTKKPTSRYYSSTASDSDSDDADELRVAA